MIILYIHCSLQMQGQGHSNVTADTWHVDLEMFGYVNDLTLLIVTVAVCSNCMN